MGRQRTPRRGGTDGPGEQGAKHTVGPVLAIDYGDVRVGLAVTDPEGQYALARETLDGTSPEQVHDTLAAMVAREGIRRIVVGLPLTLAGEEGAQAQKTRAFAAVLGARAGVPVDFVDERFTTRDGQRAADVKGVPSADAEAARLILQTWLDRQERTSVR